MIKSPVNGILVIRPLTKDEFVPIKTFSFHQNIFDSQSLITLTQEYIVAGDAKGRVLIINMKNGKETKIQVLNDKICLNEVQACMISER
jgi:hypothetical protein